MDREKLKSAGRRGGKAAAAVVNGLEPGDVLGMPEEVLLKGKTYVAGAVTFNDLRLAQRRFGSLQAFLDGVSTLDLDAVLFLAWASLRKEHPDLEEETLGDLLPIRETELAALLETICRASGLSEKKGAQPEAVTTP